MIAVVLGVMILALAAGAAWWFLLRSTPEKAAAQYVAAVRAGDEEKAKAALSSQTLREVENLQKTLSGQFGAMAGNTIASMKMASKLLPAAQFNVDMEIGKAEVKGNTATIPLQLKPKGGNMPEATLAGMSRPLKLVREGGQWKVDFSNELKMAQQMMPMFAQLFGGASPAKMQNLAQSLANQRAALQQSAAKGAAAQERGAAQLVLEGTAAKRQGKLAEAAAKLQQAVGIDPANTDAHWGLAWVLAEQKKTTEAVAEFQKVVDLNADPTKVSEAQKAIARLRQQ